MSDDLRRTPGIELFWEQADLDGSGEHPLERELSFRLDVLVRTQHMISDADASGRNSAVEHLLNEHRRHQDVVDRIREVLLRQSASRGDDG
jgi:hypothetical protein